MLKKIRISAKKWVSNRKSSLMNSNKLRKLTMCKKCYTFYYKNSWHFDRPTDIKLNEDIEVPVRFTNCSACLEEDLAIAENESGLVWGI